MKLEKDTFRIDLRSAKLCIELDCNTVFDASMYRHCPTCGSLEFYPLESWLNRDRVQKPVRAAFSADPADTLDSAARAIWFDRSRDGRADNDRQTMSLAVPRRAQRRRTS